MAKALVNVKTAKFCSLCKSWFDPAYKYLSPKVPQAGQWEYDTSGSCMCLKTGIMKKASETCARFKCKVED